MSAKWLVLGCGAGLILASFALADDPYCPGGAQNCDEYISQLDLGDFSNPSGCGLGSGGTPGYSDYTAMTILIESGQTYMLMITNGNPIWTDDTCGVWIDWNGDYVLAEPGEFYDLGTGVGPYSMSITIPWYVEGYYRLRIRIGRAEAPMPCGVADYGEVEDYTLRIAYPHDLGDVNCDGLVNAFDIDPFVKCMVFQAPTAPCTDCDMADFNMDGLVNAFDIDPFVQCVINGG